MEGEATSQRPAARSGSLLEEASRFAELYETQEQLIVTTLRLLCTLQIPDAAVRNACYTVTKEILFELIKKTSKDPQLIFDEAEKEVKDFTDDLLREKNLDVMIKNAKNLVSAMEGMKTERMEATVMEYARRDVMDYDGQQTTPENGGRKRKEVEVVLGEAIAHLERMVKESKGSDSIDADFTDGD